MSERNASKVADDRTTASPTGQPSDAELCALLKWVLGGVHEQIRFADSKAAFVVLFHTLLFGLLVTQAPTLASLGEFCLWSSAPRLLLIFGYAAASIASIVYALKAVLPRLGNTAPRCKIFFGHIAADYGRHYMQYHDASMSTTAADWVTDITSQIVETSNIAADKHAYVRRSVIWGVVALMAAATVVLFHFGEMTFRAAFTDCSAG